MLTTVIKPNTYQDSVSLMLLSQQLTTLSGVNKVSVMMGQKFWLRLVARTRALGAGPIRLSRHHRAQLRRHFFQQQLQEWPAAHRVA